MSPVMLNIGTCTALPKYNPPVAYKGVTAIAELKKISRDMDLSLELDE